jgi:hypothetical protein
VVPLLEFFESQEVASSGLSEVRPQGTLGQAHGQCHHSLPLHASATLDNRTHTSSHKTSVFIPSLWKFMHKLYLMSVLDYEPERTKNKNDSCLARIGFIQQLCTTFRILNITLPDWPLADTEGH